MSSRRLAAIMFSDIVGYTAMMQQDESLGRQKAKRYRSVLQAQAAQFHGEIIQHYGDGSLTLFNSAVEAVHCAKALQEALSKNLQVPVRIGIHVGDIVQEGDEIFGDGVNVASRVESMGVPGSVIFTERVAVDLQSHPDLVHRSLGHFSFKHVDKALELFALSHPGILVPDPSDMKGKGKVHKKEIEGTNKLLIRSMLIAFLGALIGVGIWSGLGTKSGSSPSSETDIPKTLAVFTFDNLSEGSENESFTKGVSSDVRTHMTKIKDLKISYAQAEKELGTTAVGYILDGSVRIVGDQVRVSAQLVNRQTQDMVWAENYDRELTGIFDIQSNIAKSIAEALEITLSNKEEAAIGPYGTDNLEALKLFNKVRRISHRTPDDLQRIIDSLHKVIELDPSFAAAHARLGEMYGFLHSWWNEGQVNRTEAIQMSVASLKKAKELNPYEESVYRRLMGINMHHFWDYEEAQRNVTKALEIAPNASGPLDYQRWLYTVQGKFAKSVEFGEKVEAMLPTYKWGNAHFGLALYLNGEEKRAKQVLVELVTRDSSYNSGVWRLAQVYLDQDSAQKAIDLLEPCLAKQQNFRPAALMATLGGAYAAQGEWGKANSLIQELEDRIKEGYSFFIAMIYAAAEDKEKTLEWLERSYQNHDFELVWAKTYPVFWFLQGNEQYDDLLKRLNLSPT